MTSYIRLVLLSPRSLNFELESEVNKELRLLNRPSLNHYKYVNKRPKFRLENKFDCISDFTVHCYFKHVVKSKFFLMMELHLISFAVMQTWS